MRGDIFPFNINQPTRQDRKCRLVQLIISSNGHSDKIKNHLEPDGGELKKKD